MAKTKTAELSNVDFIVHQLRNLANSDSVPDMIRMQALDRLAVIAGVYKVEKHGRQQ